MPRRGENIRKRKDGRWEGRYIQSYTKDGKAKYASLYGKSYNEVKKRMQEAASETSYCKSNIKYRDLCFKEVLVLWLNNNRVKLRIQTYSKYLELIEKHIIPELGSIKISHIDSYIVNSFLDSKRFYGRLDGKGGLSPSYIKTIAYIIRASIDYACQENLRQPMNNTINKPTRKKANLVVLSDEEQIKLENYLINNIDCSKLGILICLNMGLRIGEVCGLMWDDIDYKNETLHILRTVERIRLTSDNLKAKTQLTICEPKTFSSNRIIPIPSNLLPLIHSINKESTSKYVIEGISYSFIDPRTYQYRFHKYLSDCNINRVNFHTLRHYVEKKIMWSIHLKILYTPHLY